MTTYGKKKRALFPSFSVFQDNDQASSRTHNRSAYTQLAVDDNPPKPSISHDDADDDEIDELASTSLVNVPTQPLTSNSTKRGREVPIHIQAGAADNSHPASVKPLPSLSSKSPLKGSEPSKTKMRVLAPKSTNQKVIRKSAKVPPKPEISPPTLISSSIDPYAGTVAPGGLPRHSLNELDTRVSTLTQQADAHEAETTAREKLLALAEASFKPSPLQRSRSVLMTAKHAITRRLGSPNIKLGRFKTPLTRKSSAPTGSSVNEPSEPVSAAPRPLPVYESMRSRRETPEPHDNDPFSDKMEMDEAWSDFDFSFDPHKDQGVALPSRTSSINRTDEPPEEALLVQPHNLMSFSNKVSGLKQHPYPEFFSSSPVGFSTPRVRLEPTADANGKKRLSTVLVRDPLSHGVSSESDNTDEEDDPLVHNELNQIRGSNMKRKSATEDLHSQMSKRAKTDSGASGGTDSLAPSLDRTAPGDGQSMQGIERIGEDVTSVEGLSQGKGFGIYDTSKGEETETRSRASVDSLDLRRHSRRYSSSVSRPTSVLFSRETRAKVPLLDSYKEDQMDIDELQMDDPPSKR